jgi:hypothetical protein
MVTDTCISLITYENIDDILTEPFRQARKDKVAAMFDEGKTSSINNAVVPDHNPPEHWTEFYNINPAPRAWVDHAAAQEFMDWVRVNARIHNVVIASTAIEDL